MRKNLFEVESYKGKKVVFKRAKWLGKKIDHPELGKKTFIDCIKRCIIEPDEVWENYSNKDMQCYYKKHSRRTYAKVVIYFKDSPQRVVTAYEINKIKEADYPSLNKIF